MIDMKKPSCETCMYCETFSEAYGECRIMPPSMVAEESYAAVWPQVSFGERQWCGQWRHGTPEYDDPLGDRIGDRLGVKHD
jgi:hypothetical protein